LAAYPLALSTDAGEITLPEQPTRIVSLYPTGTEMLFAIGAGEQVIAVDDQSNYPDNVPRTSLSGFTPNIEAIAGYTPDLVVVGNDIDGMVGALQALNIPVMLLPASATLDDTYAQLELLGKATGHPTEAAAVVQDMKDRVAEVVGDGPERSEPLTYYHELDPTLYTATSSTFIGQVYALLGLDNIADKADDGSGYPQLSAEFIVEQDPDLVFLADTKCCQQDATTVAERPGWASLSAVTGGRVIELDDDVASRWGPRTVEFLEQVAEQVAAVAPE